MEFIYIDSILENYTIQLDVLTPNAQLYSTMLLQHVGSFSVRENFFGNENDESAKFNQFLNKARADNIELVITPEYSFPWQSIRNILEDSQNFPNIGKLWVFGCESITPDEIFAFRDNHNGQNNIEVYFEDDIFENSTGVLLDPCCYIFKALDANNIEKLIVLVQFKTENMGVWTNDIERQKLIAGNRAYILRNNVASINLLTIICSDAIQFNCQTIPGRWSIDPYIILSVQMNPSPNHERFRTFRNTILKCENKDVLSLNWNSKSNIFNEYSKSNIAINTDHIKNRDLQEQTDLELNHAKGLYYSFMKPKRHCFYLNPNVNVAIYNIGKSYAGADDPVRHRRRGPRMHAIYEWDEEQDNFFEIPTIDDGFLDLLNSLGITSQGLLSEDLSFLDKERLINLTVGEVDTKDGANHWHHINKLKSFLLNDSESINRFTVTFDQNSEDYRHPRIIKIEELNKQVLPDPNNFPDVIATFRNNCNEVMFLNDNGLNYNYNLVTSDNENHATAIFLGQVPENKAHKVLSKILELFPEKYRKFERVVVWFKPDINHISFKSTETPTIVDAKPNDMKSII